MSLKQVKPIIAYGLKDLIAEALSLVKGHYVIVSICSPLKPDLAYLMKLTGYFENGHNFTDNCRHAQDKYIHGNAVRLYFNPYKLIVMTT